MTSLSDMYLCHYILQSVRGVGGVLGTGCGFKLRGRMCDVRSQRLSEVDRWTCGVSRK